MLPVRTSSHAFQSLIKITEKKNTGQNSDILSFPGKFLVKISNVREIKTIMFNIPLTTSCV